MTIASEVARLQTAKAAIKTAIEAKGVTVPSSATLDAYDDYVESIPSGGGGEVESVTITNKAAFENLTFPGTYLTIPLNVVVLPANAPQITQVTVSDPGLARVKDNGDGTHSIHILRGGTCTVTVKDYTGAISDSVTFTINQPLEDISFPYTSLNVAEGGTRQLMVQFKPSTATNQNVVWASDNPNITVSQTGLVTATSTGSAAITAYNAELEKTITCRIEVAAYVDNPDWAYIKAHKQDYGLGSEFHDKMTYNNTEYDITYRVVAQGYQVKKEDGTTASAMIIMATQSLPFSNRFSSDTAKICDSVAEPTALADTYYYGKNGSTYTKLNLEIGDPIPYTDYATIYKSGLLFKTGQIGKITQGYHNRWDGSEIRAILNSDADNVKTSYTPVYISDVVNYTGKGFLQMINPNLVTVAEPIRNTTVENNSCFNAGTYETVDKFWLPAAYQMNFSGDSATRGPEGQPFQWFVDEIGTATDSGKECRKFIPIGGSSPDYYWLRSAYYSFADFERVGDTDGSLDYYSANYSIRFVPACAIC